MTKLDLVLARIRKLPPERQEAMAVQIDFMLEDEAQGSILTDAQWAEVEAALADKDEPVSTMTFLRVWKRKTSEARLAPPRLAPAQVPVQSACEKPILAR